MRRSNLYVALVRGINVVGSRLLPMSDLKLLLERHGCQEVQTYIRSGNAIFRSATSDTNLVAKRLTVAIGRVHGFEPRVLVLRQDELERAAAGNPFPQAAANPKSLHLFFLASEPAKPDVKALDAVKTQTEQFVLKGRTFYLYTPDGFGMSRLAARAERLLGVEATARNWRTVTRLLDMMRLVSASASRARSR